MGYMVHPYSGLLTVFTGYLTKLQVPVVMHNKAYVKAYVKCSEYEPFIGQFKLPGLGPGRLVPSCHQRSKFSNSIFSAYSRGDKRARQEAYMSDPPPGEKSRRISADLMV